MKIRDIIHFLEEEAPLSYQEGYDNAGLLTGSPLWECSGVLTTLDCLEATVDEAISKKANLIIAHHPILFKGLKKLNGSNYVERVIIKAVRNDIAVYAIHTNLDNVIKGVNGRIADKLGIKNRTVLLPMESALSKIFTYIPTAHFKQVRQAIFDAGAGNVGNYSECSFAISGKGSFKGNDSTNPFVGEPGSLHEEEEVKLEVIFPRYLKTKVIGALMNSHPYEEVAYEIISLDNQHSGLGSGLVGELAEPVPPVEFLAYLKRAFGLAVIRHTNLSLGFIRKVALCGGAGSFLLPNAMRSGADVFITADMKYHEFFDAEGRILICDIGHFESEQFTIDLLYDILVQKFPTFAILKTEIITNPVNYFIG